jgi:Protein of unknown function (DUF3014)
MSDFDEFDLDPEKKKREDEELEVMADYEPPPPEPPLPLGLIALAVVMVLGLGTAVYFLYRRQAPAPATAPSSVGGTASPAPSEPPVSLPSLDESDGFVRQLAQGLSSHPQLSAWLAAKGLVRTFAVCVQNIAEGRSPAQFVPFLAPRERFKVVEKAGRPVADPRSFAAYDDFADAVASLDTPGAARVYRTMLPLLNAAYAELGYPNTDFSKPLQRAIARLLETPLPEGDVALKKGVVFYEYADPAFEELSLAQKQLLRTGPRNAKILQAKLRDLYRELGFTPEAPPPHS